MNKYKKLILPLILIIIGVLFIIFSESVANYMIIIVGGILAIYGIADRNGAETLRGKFLCVDRDSAVKLEEGRYFVVDLIGCKVITDTGVDFGVVTDLTEAKTDYFTISTTDNRIARFPFLKDLVLNVDVQNKSITVKEKRLNEVCVYENWYINVISRNV